MDKPKSLSVRDFLIRKMSIKLNLSEKIIESVITHQFQSAIQAMDDNKTIEMSGFGKFTFNDKKAVSKMKKLEGQKKTLESNVNNELFTEQRRRSSAAKLQSVLDSIEILKPKINECQSDIRRVEE